MRTLLKKLFINNWPRKCLSIILAIIIWYMVNKSLITTKTVSNVPIKIENIPPGKTIDGIQSTGYLNQRINLTFSGKKSVLDDITSNDIHVVFDASGQDGEWIASVNRKNIQSDNPDLNLTQGISRISHQNFIIKLSKLVTEKIPIIITKPIGESPQGYQFLDIWPYQLYITIRGAEDLVKKLKSSGLKLTFNLNDITRAQLDELASHSTKKHADVVTFFVPNHLKQIAIPLLSATPIEINDPEARYLRIDFLRYEMLKVPSPLPVALYFPPSTAGKLNPQKVALTPNQLVENRNGIKMITEPLYVKGVSALFLEMVKDMIEIIVIVNPNGEEILEWSPQFINARELEERYVRYIKSDASGQSVNDLQPQARDDYLRNRFRNYMKQFQLYKSTDEVFNIVPKLTGNSIIITENKHDES